jgi:1-acyl-sn-glycerol-3-phosphate acyltransferase
MWVRVVLFTMHSLAASILISDRHKRLQYSSRTLTRHARKSVNLLNINLRVEGPVEELGKGNYLVVANHLSYVDIIIISALLPSLFVTSVEVKNSPFQGFMSRLGGSLFVERRKRSGLRSEISTIARTVREGVSVVVFPEGTSSNGDNILPFKSSLFSAATEGGTDILPLCIRYTAINGRPITAENRDRIYYYGDLVFVPHLLKLPFTKSIDVTVSFLDPVSPDNYESRKKLAEDIRNRIAAVYHGGKDGMSGPGAGSTAI